MTYPAVVVAMQTAVDAEPGYLALRLHPARQLLDAGDGRVSRYIAGQPRLSTRWRTLRPTMASAAER